MEQQSNFEKLISQLKELIFIYRALLTISVAKKEVIINNNIVELNKFTLSESKLVDKVSNSEEAIRQLIISLQRDLGFRPKIKMKLSELLKMLIDTKEKNELNEILTELMNITDKLRASNELNQELVENALAYINFSIEAIMEVPNEDVTYRHPMQVKRNGYR